MTEALSVWRVRFEGLLCDGNGDSPFVVAANHFHRIDDGRTVYTVDLNGGERAVEIGFGPSRDIGESINNMHMHRALQTIRMEVRVVYLLTHEGITFEASGEQDGPGDTRAIESRAKEDRDRIVMACTWQVNHGGMTPNAIHIIPSQEDRYETLEDRIVHVTTLDITTRIAFPIAAPSIVGS